MVGGILEHSAVQLTFELNTDVSAGILFEESPCCQEFFYFDSLSFENKLEPYRYGIGLSKQVTLIF